MEKMTIKKIIFGLALIVASATFVTVASASSYCSTSGGTMTVTQSHQALLDHKIVAGIVVSGSQAVANISNQTDCALPVSLISWKMFDRVLANQTKFANSGPITVGPNSSATLKVGLPTCMAQVDLYYGTGPGNNPGNDLNTIFAYNFSLNQTSNYYDASGPFCTNNPPPPPPPAALTGSCSVNSSTVNVGQNVTWTSSASGGTNSYVYSWSGTDGLSGNSSGVSKSYSSAGTKNGTVTITSGDQSIVRGCTMTVTQTINDDLNVSCNANSSRIDVGESINWRSNVSGGNGSYTYSWSGDDGLYGNSSSVSRRYYDSGEKDAYVTVTSNGQSASASCSARVEDENDDLSVSCYANPSTVNVGRQMNWYVRVSGGDGDYDYDWEGDDDLNSSSRSPSMVYDSSGTKEAEVTVRDGDGNRDTDTCTVRVNQNTVLAFSEPSAPIPTAVYLSQVPYTGFADNKGLIWFTLGLALFSAYVAYVVITHKKSVGEWQ